MMPKPNGSKSRNTICATPRSHPPACRILLRWCVDQEGSKYRRILIRSTLAPTNHLQAPPALAGNSTSLRSLNLCARLLRDTLPLCNTIVQRRWTKLQKLTIGPFKTLITLITTRRRYQGIHFHHNAESEASHLVPIQPHTRSSRSR